MKDDEEFERFIMQRSMEKVKCFIADVEIIADKLKEDVENLQKHRKVFQRIWSGST